MDIRFNKRGFFFSLFVISALALVVLNFKTKVQFREELNAEIYANRVEEIDFFIEDMEKDIERVMFISSYRAFLGLEEYWLSVDPTGPAFAPFTELEKNITEMMLNGTIAHKFLNATNRSTIKNWSDVINNLGSRYGINVTLTNVTIGLSHADPWLINVSMNATITIGDIQQQSTWNYPIQKSTFIDLRDANFSDPFYYWFSNANYMLLHGPTPPANPLTNRVRRTSHENLWWNNSGTVDVTNLTNHTQLQMYYENPNAPSFLMRLRGQNGGSPHGIESFVNVVDPSYWQYSWISNIPDYTTCVADWQFFQVGCQGTKNNISGMDPTLFFLDDNTTGHYDLTQIIVP